MTDDTTTNQVTPPPAPKRSPGTRRGNGPGHGGEAKGAGWGGPARGVGKAGERAPVFEVGNAAGVGKERPGDC